MFDLVFSNPALQNTFSRATDGGDEIGGWLFCTSEPTSWPIKFSWRNVKKAINSPNGLLFIESFMLIPNGHKEPTWNWSTWDFQKTKEIAEQTAKAFGAWPIHFHTHPNSNPKTSYADIGFAGANCQVFLGHSNFSIVTHSPLRVYFYQLTWGSMATPDKGQLQVSEFVSWRQRRMRDLLK
jgi:hypothetical protein